MEKDLINKRILITGGAGFIGSNLCEYFLQKKNRVVCLDNFSTGKKENIESFLDNELFTLIEGDIRDYDICLMACNDIDYVFHEAALGSVPRSINDPISTTDVNISGFVKMLYAAKEKGVKRFIYAASSSTYGDHTALPKVEDKIGKPLSPYAITKYVNELYAENFSKLFGLETIGLRYFNVFGRRQDPNGAYAAVIPLFVKQLMKHQSPRINGDGEFSRDFTYIDNVIFVNECAAVTTKAVIFSITCPKETHLAEVFNIAFGERTSLNNLVQYLKNNLSRFDPKISSIKPIHCDIREGDIPHSLASIKKAQEILGYYPKYSVKEELEIACEWYWNNL